MLLLLAITRYTNNCITVHRLHSDYEALPLRVNKHIVQFLLTVFIIIDISTLDTTSGDEVPTNTSCRSPAYEMSLPQFPAFSLSEGNLNLGPRWAKWLSRFNRLMVAMEIADPPRCFYTTPAQRLMKSTTRCQSKPPPPTEVPRSHCANGAQLYSYWYNG